MGCNDMAELDDDWLLRARGCRETGRNTNRENQCKYRLHEPCPRPDAGCKNDETSAFWHRNNFTINAMSGSIHADLA
jgi:hypothetical protein